MQSMQIQSLGQEDPLQKEMATHCSIIAWKSPMDRGAWQAIVHRVAKSGAWLRGLTTTTSSLGMEHSR